MVTGEIVAMAMNATGWHRSQIQIFLYRDGEGRDHHVVRDVTRTYDKQCLAQEIATADDYEGAHARMALAVERAQADVLADRINRLMGAH